MDHREWLIERAKLLKGLALQARLAEEAWDLAIAEEARCSASAVSAMKAFNDFVYSVRGERAEDYDFIVAEAGLSNEAIREMQRH